MSNINSENKSGWKSVLVSLIILQLVTNLSIIFNIALIRQVIGFFYLIFINGFLLLNIFGMNKLEVDKKIIYSIGLSISLLYFIGLIINELYPLIGILKPLSTKPLLVTFNIVLLLLCFLCYKKNNNLSYYLQGMDFSLSKLFFLLFPLLGIFGLLKIKNSNDNLIMILITVIVPIIIIISIYSKKLNLLKYYSFILVIITVTLLLPNQLMTQYISGWDHHGEYYVFKVTENRLNWDLLQPPEYSNETYNYINQLKYPYNLKRFNAMLSVTILPMIFSQILNIEGSMIFKIIYSCIFVSFIALGSYLLYQTQCDKKESALAAFFFIINIIPECLPSEPNKQIIAHLFFVLLLLTIFDKKISLINRKILFIIFSFSLVFSHYSTSYIFLYFILFTLFISLIIKNSNRRISITFIMIFITIVFSWYIYTSESVPFNSLINVLENISNKFIPEFFDLGSRSTETLRGLGLSGENISFLHRIGRFTFQVTILFIFFGFIEIIYIFVSKNKDLIFDLEYAILIFAAMSFMMMNIFLPFFSRSFGTGRSYNLSQTILAPLFISGGKMIFKNVLKIKKKNTITILILIIMIVFFMFQTELLYEVTGDDGRNLSLSMYRMDGVIIHRRVVREQEVFSAQWLLKYKNPTDSLVCADVVSYSHVLISYGLSRGALLLHNTTKTVSEQTFIYLRWVNKILGTIEVLQYDYDIADIAPLLMNQNKIYSNGGSDMYKGWDG